MSALPRTSRTDRMAFQEFVEQSRNEIAHDWREAVEETIEVSTETVEEPLLLNSVPLVLDEILSFIESEDGQIDIEKIRRAARHNRGRTRERFDIRDFLREYQILRICIFRYLHSHVSQFAGQNAADMAIICHRAGQAMDQAVRESINTFVEDHTGQLRHLSRTDSLTGLYNHRTFYARLDEELGRASRYANSLSIGLIDLDNFKFVNDTRGHLFGDDLLVKTADWLEDQLRQTDVICRYGGDEFAMILPETTGADAGRMMSRVAEAFFEFGVQEGASACFGMSFGLSSYPEDGSTVRRMVKIADERLLANKQRKKSGSFPSRDRSNQTEKRGNNPI